MKHGVFVFCILLCFCVTARANDVTPQDFAEGMILEIHGKGPFFSLELPAGIYEGTTREDLGDLRVFNADGKPVPHIIRQPETTPKPLMPPVLLPFFPVPEQGQDPGRAEREEVSLQINTDNDGTIIDVKTGKGRRLSGKRPRLVLLDLSHLDYMPAELELEWNNAGINFVTSVSVEGSRDLTRWEPVTDRAGLAEQHFSGHALHKNRISLQNTDSSLNYLRINFPADAPGLGLTKVKAVFPEIQSAPQRRWRGLEGNPVPGADVQAFEYDAKGAFPVDRVNIFLPEKNSLIKALIKSRPQSGSEWKLRRQGIFYRLSVDDTNISNHVLPISPVTDRYWRIEVTSGTAASPGSSPELRIGWIAHRLLFLARGKAPFTLAFGSTGVGPPEATMGDVLEKIKESGKNKITTEASVEKRVVLGGDKALEKRQPPVDWKTWLLWGILAAGVFCLGYMAYRLYRQMETERTP
ncbi:MAG: DUF3999 domain-containing protein [Desulfobacteraceae bacterium]|nr:DUF3999 domain-containing protein [Desulfobacteraceae bacterium]